MLLGRQTSKFKHPLKQQFLSNGERYFKANKEDGCKGKGNNQANNDHENLQDKVFVSQNDAV